MNKHTIIFLNIVLLLVLLLNFQPTSAHKTISTTQPMIPYTSFNSSTITYDGKQQESGFNNITITTKTDSVVQLFWRQNNKDLHVVLTVDKYAWIGIGWTTNVPQSSTDLSLIDNVNFIIATNTFVNEYTGSSNGFTPTTKSDLINSSVYTDLFGIYMEFTIPLNSTLSSAGNLIPKSFSNFMFAIGDSYIPNEKPLDSGNLLYLQNVYIESNAKEGYVAPPTTPFTDLYVISVAIISLIALKKVKIIKFNK